jgi:hypothetical protein
MRPVNDEELLLELDRHMNGRGNGVKTADAIGMDPNHLRSVRSGRERVSVKIAAWLGYELRWVKRFCIGDKVRLVNREPIDSVAQKLGLFASLSPAVEVGDVGTVIKSNGKMFEVRFAKCVIVCDEMMVQKVDKKEKQNEENKTD